MACNKWFLYLFLIFTTAMLLIVYIADGTNNCQWKIGYFRIVFLVLCFLTRLSSEIPQTCKWWRIVILTTGISGLIAWLCVATFFYADNFVKSPECCNIANYLIDGTVIGLTFIYQNVILVYFSVKVCQLVKQRKKHLAFEKDLQEIYENIYNEELDLEKFIEIYRELIEEEHLFDYEIMILKETSGFTYVPNKKSKFKNDDCLFCDKKFKNQDSVVQYPLCNHSYHLNCQTEWQAQKNVCPICKKNIRTSLLLSLNNKVSTSMGYSGNELILEQTQKTPETTIARQNSNKVYVEQSTQESKKRNSNCQNLNVAISNDTTPQASNKNFVALNKNKAYTEELTQQTKMGATIVQSSNKANFVEPTIETEE